MEKNEVPKVMGEGRVGAGAVILCLLELTGSPPVRRQLATD